MQKGIFVFAFLFFFGVSGSTSAQTSCLLYPSNSSAPSGYGVSWDVTTPEKELLVKSNCPASGITVDITIGKGNADQFIWSKMYVYNSAATPPQWDIHTLTGTIDANGWVTNGSGTKTVTAPHTPSTSNPLYFVGYVCTPVGLSWKCGCANSACTSKRWQLQGYTGNGGGGTATGGTSGGSTGGTGGSSTGGTGGTTGGGEGTFRAIHRIGLQQDTRNDNLRGIILMGNLDSDAQPEFIIHTGSRLIKAYEWDGTLMWRIHNPQGWDNTRSTVPESLKHPNFSAVWDMDGDGDDEIIHCWANGASTAALLIVRDGRTGTVLAQTPIEHGNIHGCYTAVVHFEGDARPTILVNTRNPALTERNWSEVLVRNAAYDFSGTSLSMKWDVSTPDAGHWWWPIDTDRDGKQEFIMAGKYALNSNGSIRFKLTSIANYDHADGIVIGDIDPNHSGYELAVVGATEAFLHALDGTRIRELGPGIIVNPQRITTGEFVPSNPGLELFILRKDGRNNYLVSGTTGQVLRTVGTGTTNMQQVNFDGNKTTDEILAELNLVVDGENRKKQADGWPRTASGMTSNRWNVGFAADIIGDGREEIITHGDNDIVIGGFQTGTPTIRGTDEYRMRFQAIKNEGRGLPYYVF